MRQPLSIYIRALRLSSARNLARAVRKIRKIAGKGAEAGANPETRPVVDLSQVSEALTALGIHRGDRVIVHSGISHLGKVKGGAQGIFSLLRERIGDEGTLLFPAFTFGGLMYHYLETSPIFDARTSPAKMGAVADIALADQARLRSVHPTHSVVAFGKDAREYVEGHHLDSTPFGPRSAFWRLADTNGKILVIGVGLSSVTSFHLTEDRLGAEFPVRVYLDKTYSIPCTSDAGEVIQVSTPAHDPLISLVRDCYLVEDDFVAEGIYKKYSVGSHYLGVIDAASMDACLQRLFYSRGVSIYGHIWG